MESDKPKKKRSFSDRRSGQDRRSTYNIDYFVNGGAERRNSAAIERRKKKKDRRKNWIKISRWSSLYIEYEQNQPANGEEPPDIE
jgi:hypothetical protein